MTASRRFLFLQGPHGPFFAGLARRLTATGAECFRVGFNRGDQAFWWDRTSYFPYRDGLARWPGFLAEVLEHRGVTDVVLYGDTRPIHAEAVRQARAKGLTIHVFEEGYLRPYWISYERGGSNGHSRLMSLTVPDMAAALEGAEMAPVEAPAHWGDMRQHIFYGALYHAFVLVGNRRYVGFTPHRALTVRQEFRLHVMRLLTLPLHIARRMLATSRIRHGGFPYHVALLQLEHDASFQHHSALPSMADFVTTVIDGFARGAPGHHHLVFKAHPLEDDRVPLLGTIQTAAKTAGISERVHFVRGGKLARLLDASSSVVTVNSTAAEQALWRGLPLKAFGEAVYAKPEFVSDQPLVDFFAEPRRPDHDAYLTYRHYLLETSQIPGGFYSGRGRRQLYRRLVDHMLDPRDRYDGLTRSDAAPGQHLRLVDGAG